MSRVKQSCPFGSISSLCAFAISTDYVLACLLARCSAAALLKRCCTMSLVAHTLHLSWHVWGLGLHFLWLSAAVCKVASCVFVLIHCNTQALKPLCQVHSYPNSHCSIPRAHKIPILACCPLPCSQQVALETTRCAVHVMSKKHRVVSCASCANKKHCHK